jgi:pimeloyl-ACP methyl ester carboxylesterase
MAAAAPERVSGLVLSGTWLQPSRFMRELFRSRAALLHASPEEYAAQAVFTSYPPEWLDAHWDVLERAIQAAPTTPAARAVIAERIEALLAFDGSAPAARIAAPTLVLGAADDLIVPAFLQRELASALPGSRLHLFPDGGHFFPVSRADLYLDQLTRWIDAAR